MVLAPLNKGHRHRSETWTAMADVLAYLLLRTQIDQIQPRTGTFRQTLYGRRACERRGSPALAENFGALDDASACKLAGADAYLLGLVHGYLSVLDTRKFASICGRPYRSCRLTLCCIAMHSLSPLGCPSIQQEQEVAYEG